MSKRTCKYRYCGVSLDGRRPQCDYCTPAHRAAESRERRADAAGTPLPRPKPHRNRTSGLRRANRDGVGTRLYVTGPEITLVREVLRELPGGVYGPFNAKLERAAARIKRKGG